MRYKNNSEKNRNNRLSLYIDKLRLKKISKSPEGYEAYNMAIKIKDASYKIEAIKLLPREYWKWMVAKTLPDDESKLTAVDLIKDEQKVGLIETLSTDEYKLEAIKHITEKYYIEEALTYIEAFKDITISKLGIYEAAIQEYSEKNIIESINDKVDVLDRIKKLSDEEKIEYIENTTDKYIIAEIVATISDDDKKLTVINYIEDENSKVQVLKTIRDDNKKIEIIKNIGDDNFKLLIAETIKDDNCKIEAIKHINEEWYKATIISKLEDDNKKIECIKQFAIDDNIIEVLYSIRDENKIINSLSLLNESRSKYLIINKIKDKEKRMELVLRHCDVAEIKMFCERIKEEEKKTDKKIKEVEKLIKEIQNLDSESDEYKLEKIASLNNVYLITRVALTIKDDNKKIEVINCLEFIKDKIIIIDNLKDPKQKLNLLSDFSIEQLNLYRRQTMDTSFVKENIIFFVTKEGVEVSEVKELIEELYEKNNEVVKNIDLRLLTPQYLNMLGKEKVNLISCYPQIQEAILQLDLKELTVFSKCIEDYMNDAQTEEWTTLAEAMLKNIKSKEYAELLENIEDIDKVDIDTLRKILQSKNVFGIKNIEDITRYEQIKKEKTDKWIEGKNIWDKRRAVLEKIFGQDIEYSKEIIGKYGQDIDSLPESDIKYYVKCVQKIMSCTSGEVLHKIYDECKETTFVDRAMVERKLKTEYGKLYNEGLLKIGETEPLGENMYLVGTEFRMIITSVGAYCQTNKRQNYKEDWNRPALSSQHFCASYIREDMIATAPINNVCYGFDGMAEDALMLAGARDIYSTAQEFVSSAGRNEAYYTPDNEINNTKRHNELDFRRNQNGEKKQPSYIVVFRKKGKIEHFEEAKKAQQDWGNMPIVIVDVDECLKREKAKVNDMIKEYQETKDQKLAQKIYYKIRNNRETDEKFCENIDIGDFLEKTSHKKQDEKAIIKQNQFLVTEKDLEENDEKVMPNERKDKQKLLRRLFDRINEIEGRVELIG